MVDLYEIPNVNFEYSVLGDFNAILRGWWNPMTGDLFMSVLTLEGAPIIEGIKAIPFLDVVARGNKTLTLVPLADVFHSLAIDNPGDWRLAVYDR